MNNNDCKVNKRTINKSITSNDVAKKAGVSQSTVSRAFYPNSNLKKETRDLVLKVAAELGYKPNAIARSLISNKTNIIGIVMGDVESPFYSLVLSIITNRLRDIGKQVLLFNIRHNEEIDSVLSKVLQYKVDGIIITHATISSKMANECSENGIPVVLFNRHIPDSKVNSVSCDNNAALREVVNYFVVEKGFTNMVYISGTENSWTNIERQRGFNDRLKELGIESCIVEYGDYSYEGGKNAIKKILKNNGLPEGVFCASDLMALGAMDYIRYDLGLKIPEDVSVVGFDDIYMASWPAYNLTTVRQPIEEMVDATIELLENKIEDLSFEPVIKLFKGKLILRGSA